MSYFTIRQPHDSFFKRSLSNLTVAKDFLQAHLNPTISQRIQWDTLRLSNKSYTDKKLKQLHSDLVYTCQIDKQGPHIYILLEQQTTPVPLLPFRFLKYDVAIIDEHLAQNKKGNRNIKLPIILNLCLYSGKQTPYPYSVDLCDCFESSILDSPVLLKPPLLVDLGQMSEEEIRKHGTAYIMELLLKQGRKRTFLTWIKEHPALVVRMMDTLFDIYGISSIVFILSVEGKHSPEEIIDAIGDIVPHKKENIMTAAQQLEQRGMQQGMQQGIQQGMQQGMHTKALNIAKNMLAKLHLDIKTVAEATGLSERELIKLQKENKENS